MPTIVDVTCVVSDELGGGLIFLQVEADMPSVWVSGLWFNPSFSLNTNVAIYCNPAQYVFSNYGNQHFLLLI